MTRGWVQWRTQRNQGGMTLVETLLAVMLSGLMVLPVAGWASVSLREQRNVVERNLAGASLGVLRTYFVRDVTTADRVDVEGADTGSCSTGRKGERTLMSAVKGSARANYVIAPTASSPVLVRVVCPLDADRVVSSTELVGGVIDAGSSATCTTATELAAFTAALDLPATSKRTPQAVSADADACRRVNLTVTTDELDQVAMSAMVRVGTGAAVSAEPPTAVATASTTAGRRPVRVQFDASGSSDPEGGELSYSWDFGDGTTSTERAPVHDFTQVGSATVTLTVTATSGLTATAELQIVVSDNAPAAMIASPANATMVFRGQEVAFSSAGSNDDADKEFGGTLVGYAWDFGDGTTSTEANPKKSYSALSPVGGYTVKLAVFDDAGQTATAEIQLVVANREPSVEIVASTTEGAAPLTVDFSSVVTDETTLSPNPPVTYAWDFGDGTTSTLADPPARTYSTTGTRTVTLTVTDDQGATASATETITVGAALLPAPTNLRKQSSGTSKGQRRIDLRFNAVSGRSLYEVRITCVTNGCDDVASNTGTGTTIRISGLVNANRSWDAEVRTRNSTGQWGPWSPKVRVTT